MITRALFICLATVGIILPCDAAAPAPVCSAPSTAREVFGLAYSSTVRLRRVKQSGMGSGTVVEIDPSGETILTCAHVVADEQQMLVDIDRDGVSTLTVPAIVARVDRVHDLALVRAVGRTPGVTARPVAEQDPQLFDELYVVGAPWGLQRQSAVERVNTRDARTGVSHVLTWTFTGVSIPGMSGSGALNADGEISCVVQGLFTVGGEDFTQIGFCIPRKTIAAFVNGEK